MLEIIALIFLCKKNATLATQKGLKPAPWKFYTVIAWLVAEMLGILLGIFLLGQDNLIGIISIGIISAFGGYLIIRSILDKKRDWLDEDINQVGVSDLHPPRK